MIASRAGDTGPKVVRTIGSSEMSEFWNGEGGDAWVEMQPVLDRSYRGLEEMLVEAAAARDARRVLDVGCGAGATTVAIARRLGRGATCTGADLSEPLIEAARARKVDGGGTAHFLVADAAEHRFEKGGFDLLVSRFGVMFFADPVAAFANLRGAVALGGGLRFLAWRAPEENPFLSGHQAVAHLLPEMPPRPVGAPGPFAFAVPGRIEEVLGGAGWEGIEVRPVDVPCSFPEADLRRYLARIGPVGQALRELDEPGRTEVLDAVRGAYEPFVDGAEVRFTARCWSVGAESR